MRREYGDAYSGVGVRNDISDGKVLELLCADRLAQGEFGPWATVKPLTILDSFVFNIKVLKDAKENTIIPAFELIARRYDSLTNQIAKKYGQILTILCLEKLNEANQQK